MLQYLIMCRSLTYAQRSARVLERSGITAIVTKAPQGASQEGCAYCVKVSERRLADALRALKNAELGPKKVFVMDSSGGIREVDREADR